MCVFTVLALLCTSCDAVCRSAPHVEASIHYHSSVLDQLLLQRPSLGWLANYSTHFPKTRTYATQGQHRGENGGTNYWADGGPCISELEGLFLFVLFLANSQISRYVSILSYFHLKPGLVECCRTNCSQNNHRGTVIVLKVSKSIFHVRMSPLIDQQICCGWANHSKVWPCTGTQKMGLLLLHVRYTQMSKQGQWKRRVQVITKSLRCWHKKSRLLQ